MDCQNNTTLSSITNFLKSGALLRHAENRWILIEGPFTPASEDHNDEFTIFCPDFYDLQSARPLRGAQFYSVSTKDLQILCESYLEDQTALSPIPLDKAAWREPEKIDFATALSIVQGRIRKGEIKKAVPVVFSRSNQSITDIEKVQMLLQLLQAPPSLYVYGFWEHDEGVLGATPEVLFEVSKGVIKTMALAGTCPKSESSERLSLLEDEKEKQEHMLVLEDIKAILNKWGTVHTDGPKIVELPTLYHLKTDIEVHSQRDPSAIALLQELHPTPALGVAPRTAGIAWMKSLPGQEGRGRFGAPFAFIRGNEALCLVGIRNVQWNSSEVMIGSGCGVVSASDFEREWRELYQKRLSVRKILGLKI